MSRFGVFYELKFQKLNLSSMIIDVNLKAKEFQYYFCNCNYP